MKKDEVIQYHLRVWSMNARLGTQVSKRMTRKQYDEFYDEVVSSGGKVTNVVKEKIK